MVFGLDGLMAYSGIPVWLLVIALAWSLIWKGLALWKSSQRKSVIWFIVLLVVNTLGILEILYIFLFSEMNLDGKKNSGKKPKRKISQKKVKRKVRKR